LEKAQGDGCCTADGCCCFKVTVSNHVDLASRDLG
jgi:hypothetical protein